jgi:hypothetical protein
MAMALVLTLVCAVFAGCSKKKEDIKPGNDPVATESAVASAPPPVIYVSPYTGLPIEDTKNINRRPLSIKIENSQAAWPQMGLNSADVVYETRVEGGESRFNCIFQSNIPDAVGPVRSARLSDAWVVPQYNGLLYFSGMNSEVRARLKSAGVTFGPSGDLLRRVDFKRAPHNLYMDVKGAYKAAKKNDIKLKKTLKPLYYGFERTTDGAISGDAIVPIITQAAVSGSAVSGSNTGPVTDSGTTSNSSMASGSAVQPLNGFDGEPAKSVSLDFYSEAKWKWDAERKVWLRYTANEKHFDGATDEQVWTDNVVVMYAKYTQASKLDPAGNPTYDTDLGGEGEAMLFRDGFVYKCKWKADKNTPPALFDESGAQLPLKQGKTWFEVPPASGMDVKVE